MVFSRPCMPVGIAPQRVDLAVVGDHAERLGQPPTRETCSCCSAGGRWPRPCAPAGRPGPDNRRTTAAPETCPCRRSCGRTSRARRTASAAWPSVLGHAAFDPFAHHVEPPLQFFVFPALAADKDLPNDRLGRSGQFAQTAVVGGHVAPAQQPSNRLRPTNSATICSHAAADRPRPAARKASPRHTALGREAESPAGRPRRGRTRGGFAAGCRRRRRSIRRPRPPPGASGSAAPACRTRRWRGRGVPRCSQPPRSRTHRVPIAGRTNRGPLAGRLSCRHSFFLFFRFPLGDIAATATRRARNCPRPKYHRIISVSNVNGSLTLVLLYF